MRRENVFAGMGCSGCLISILGLIALNLTLGAYCAQYTLETWLPYVVGHAVHIPMWPHALLIGLVGGELTIPAAFITFLIMLCM